MNSRDFLNALGEDEKDTKSLPLLQRLIGLSRQRASAEMLAALSDAGLQSITHEMQRRIDGLETIPNLPAIKRATLNMYLKAALRHVRKERASRLYDCQACGACCQSGGSVLVNALDKTDIPANLTENSPFLPCARMKKSPDGACMALSGAIGERVSCAIHKVRPDACRNFTAGTSACLSARKKCGLPALDLTKAEK